MTRGVFTAEQARQEPPERVGNAFLRYATEGHVREDVADPAAVAAEKRQHDWDAAVRAAVPWRAVDRVLAGEYDPAWPAVKLTRQWLDDANGPPHIMLRGPSRSGKTVASTLIVQHWLEPGMRRGSVKLLHPNALISAILHDYDPHAVKIDKDVRLVVVDDIGRETKQAGLVEALCQLLDRRNLRVVMSTNLGKNDFRKVYSEDIRDNRLLERLRETTYAADVKPGGIRHAPGDF